MAKKQDVSQDQSVAIATARGLTVEVPDYLKSYHGPMGTENIDSGDMNIPRLKLGQALTPEVKDGLIKDGDLFHSITKQVLIPVGETGIIIPVAYVKEYILWKDQNDGGGIFARAQRYIDEKTHYVRYKWDHPNEEFKHKVKGIVAVTWRTKEFIDEDHLDQFGTSIPGERQSAPAATAHYNYIVCLPEHDYSVVALSFSRTSSKKARDLNAMLKMGQAPMFARQFQIGAIPDQNDAGQKYFNYGIVPAGFVPSQEMFDQMKRLYDEFSVKNFQVDFEAEVAGDTSAEAEKQGF